MATYPLDTLAPIVDSSGISIPSYNDVYQSLIATFQSIYGSDIYITPDSQDGQWIAVLAKTVDESNQAAVMVFQGFAPTYSQGAALSSLVKINGLVRNLPSNSTAVGNVVGVAGTIINGGVAKDVNGNLWNLPTTVTIDITGSVTVTVTAQNPGTIIAPAGSINQIYNPQLGWQSFTSTLDAIPGNPVETDSTLRIRQAASTALPALTVKESIYSAIGNVANVTRWQVYENDTGSTDANGIPAHSISCVVYGGTVADIATAIDSKKPPGIQTYGSISQVVYSSYGLPTTINFYQLALVPIYFAVTIKALTGYVASTGALLQQTLSDFVNALAIGEDVYAAQAQAAAQLIGLGLGHTFYITAFKLGTAPSPSGTSNIVVNFNQAASCDPSNVALTVT